MSNLPTVFGLGTELRIARKAKGLTQVALALRVGVAEKTIRLIERGRGNLTTLLAVLVHLDLNLVGRNFPAGNSLGEQLASLRHRRGLSQRGLSDLVAVSPPTIVALERRSTGRFDTLQSVLLALGAGAYLAPRGTTKAFYTHAGNSSTSQAWETPTEFLEALVGVFGRFDLDPCAPRQTRTRVRARVNLTIDDDGLSVPWHGLVFLNPPYGRELASWVEKAHREVEEKGAKTVVALLPARPDTNYWHEHVAGQAVVYFLRGRLRFGDGKQSAPFPSALAVWGASTETLLALSAALPEAWRVG